jgi:glycosyltransferase involved in cell wall biosynthesis
MTKNRRKLIERSINCFLAQDYPNKELIIINQGGYGYFKSVDNYIKTLNADITHVRVSGNLSLGEMRNEGLAHSKGEYICIWDDDDIFGENRLSFQVEILQRSNAFGTLLKNFITVDKKMFSHLPQKRYISFHNGGLDGTLLCRNPKYLGVSYSHIQRGEDTEFIEEMKKKGCMFLVLDNPASMYEYWWHGRLFSGNTTKRKNYEGLIRNKTSAKIRRFEAR